MTDEQRLHACSSMTLPEAQAAGYRPDGPRRFAKVGEWVWMKHPDGTRILVLLKSTPDVHAAGLRFPFERFGQWARKETTV